MNTKKIQKYLLKLKDSYANNQLNQIFKSLGLGVLTVLPFSPVTIPFVIKKAQELGIDIIPNWYKKL
jgi:hypothetical protein